ncbi:MAG: hypothetical protein OEY85_11875, partial [Rhodospirillales bacterium]|nr:hypothetical protein [Rhodospirillales bacterium]
YLTSPSLHAALFGPSDVEGEDFPGLAETALAAQWPYDADAGELVYASWRRGRVDLLSLDGESGKPDKVFEMDWGNRYATPGEKPQDLVKFISSTNPEAAGHILTRSLARPGILRGVELKLVPVSLYCYLLLRDRLRPPE